MASGLPRGVIQAEQNRRQYAAGGGAGSAPKLVSDGRRHGRLNPRGLMDVREIVGRRFALLSTAKRARRDANAIPRERLLKIARRREGRMSASFDFAR